MTRDQFLKKYLTVVGKDAAVDSHDEAFIKKYLTQVGCPGEGPEPTKYAVTFKKGSGSGNGTVTAEKAEFADGENVVLTVTPAADSELKSLTGKDEHDTPVSIDLNDFEFVMPASAVEVEYDFKLLPPAPSTYSVDIYVCSGGGTAMPEGATVTTDKEAYTEGEEVVLTVDVHEGYNLLNITGKDADENPILIDAEDPRFEMPASNVDVRVELREPTITEGEE